MTEKKKITGDESIYDPGALTVRMYLAAGAMGSFLQGGNHSDPDEIIMLSVKMADKIIEALNQSE